MKYKNVIAVYNPEGFLLDYDNSGTKYEPNEFLEAFKKDPNTTFFYFGFEDKRAEFSSSLSFIHAIAQKFIEGISQDPDIEITRVPKELSEEIITELYENKPFAIGAEFITPEWIEKVVANLSYVFQREIATYTDDIKSFLSLHKKNLHIVGKVFFHLVENKSESFPFAFLATYSTRSSERKATHLPLKNALLEFSSDHGLFLKLMSTVHKAAKKSKLIAELLNSGEIFSPLRFNTKEAYIFLKEIPFYEECGILCRIPNWWKKKTASVKISLSLGGKPSSELGLDSILSLNPVFSIDGMQITIEEFEKLLIQTNGLSLIKGKWIEIDHDKLKEVLAAYKKIENYGEITFAQAMRAQLGLNDELPFIEDENIEVSHGEWLSSVIERLTSSLTFEQKDPPQSFKAILREYQKRGYNWLIMMKKMQFGALLADDMGLGKTIQILAFLDYLRNISVSKALIIIPASLIGNWEREIKRFAPHISYKVIRSSKEIIDTESFDLIITTYGLICRLESMEQHKWDLIVLDEAQLIKNPSTKHTKAIKKLNSDFNIAMTGTPVENRLSDLWSIFDFLNKGLLGSAAEFSAFAKNIQSNSYNKLKKIITPFILRRLKTDKSIISDLPEKFEIKDYAELTKKQVVLYIELLHSLKEEIEAEDDDDIKRKGLILSALMKFKQICNHPDQYLGQMEFNPEESGKFQLLGEICGTIYEKRERVIVFTQFKELTEPLGRFLSTVFHREGLILHGSVSVKKRADIVDAFNNNFSYVPFMVLSLKAGGVGLNLTAANHVIHFDRWWNPAVENQATDRAFRIGQRKNVIVHKFISASTIEEKIDNIIEKKTRLSDNVIGEVGESWITDMDNKEIISLFALK